MPARAQRLPGRRHPRVPFASDIAVQVPDWTALQARGLDLSYGGMSLMLPQPLSIGDRLLFGLRPSNGSPMQLEAVVRNVVRVAAGRFRVGLEWAGVVGDQKHELRMFVDSVATAAA